MGIDEALREIGTLFAEFGLAEARWETAGFTVGFRRAATPVSLSEGAAVEAAVYEPEAAPAAAPRGTPVSSPMTGVFYGASSPGSPPFVKEGDTVAAGDVVGLIEAMKVFNEITAPTSGTVLQIVAQPGAVVSPGEPLLYIG